MPNVIESIGFEVEKVHSGMVRHLCRLHQDGRPEPLNAFLNALGLRPIDAGTRVRAVFEHLHIDVVLVDEAHDLRPLAAIEFKVHSCEARISSRSNPESRWQTEVYRERLNERGGEHAPFLFVTLGLAEYFRDVSTPGCDWVKLRPFLAAARASVQEAPELADWPKAIQAEVDRQECMFAGKPANADYRPGIAAAYRLAGIREILRQRGYSARSYWKDIQVCLAGSGPDSILSVCNFEGEPPALVKYAEINATNGRLNIKVGFPDGWEDAQKKATAPRLSEELRVLLEGFPVRYGKGGKWGNTKTLLQIDIGLDASSGDLRPRVSLEEVTSTLEPILNRLWGSGQP